MILLTSDMCIRTLGMYWNKISHTRLYNLYIVLQGGTLDTETVIGKLNSPVS